MTHVLFIDSNECGLDSVRMAKQLGYRVTFVECSVSHMYKDTPDNRRLLDSLDHVLTTPYTSDAVALIDLLKDHLEHHPVDAAIAPFEGALEATARVCAEFGIPFSSVAAVTAARNKEQARSLLQNAGLANAQYSVALNVAEAAAAAEKMGYPVILKPKSGMDSVCVHRADTPQDLRAAAEEILSAGDQLSPGFRQIKEQFSRGILVEQYLVGQMVSVEIGIRGDETHVFMVSGRQNTEIDECLPMGVFMPAKLSPSDYAQCVNYAKRVCQVLGLEFGLYHIEIMMTADGPVLVEANARLMGGIMPRVYRIVTGGCPIEDALLRLHLGQPFGTIQAEPRCTALVRRFIAAEDGVISQNLTDTRLAAFAGKAAEFLNYRLMANRPVKQLDLLGRVIVTAPDIELAARQGDAMIAELEEIIGVSLVRTAKDTG